MKRFKINYHRLIFRKPQIMSYRPQYTMKHIKWEINPYDSDKNEDWSIPHGDDIYPSHHSLKLDVYTGIILTAKGKRYYGKLSKDDLTRLHNDKQFQRVVEQAKNLSNQHINNYKISNNRYIFDSFNVEKHKTIFRRIIHVKHSRHH